MQARALSVAPQSSRQFVPVEISEASARVPCSLILAPGVRLELAQLPSAQWLHSTLHYLSPVAYEQKAATKKPIEVSEIT